MSSQKFAHSVCCCCLVIKSCPALVTPLWTTASLAPLSMGFSRQVYQSRLPFPPPGNLPDPGIKSATPVSLVLQACSLPDETLGSPGAFCYFLEFDRIRITVELAERNFMTRMDRYTTVNWQKLKKEKKKSSRLIYRDF